MLLTNPAYRDNSEAVEWGAVVVLGGGAQSTALFIAVFSHFSLLTMIALSRGTPEQSPAPFRKEPWFVECASHPSPCAPFRSLLPSFLLGCWCNPKSSRGAAAQRNCALSLAHTLYISFLSLSRGAPGCHREGEEACRDNWVLSLLYHFKSPFLSTTVSCLKRCPGLEQPEGQTVVCLLNKHTTGKSTVAICLLGHQSLSPTDVVV